MFSSTLDCAAACQTTLYFMNHDVEWCEGRGVAAPKRAANAAIAALQLAAVP